MNQAESAIAEMLEAQKKSGKPLAVVLAGHNGSGKSTLWEKRLAKSMQIPLVNADRMMLSILPAADEKGHLPLWAQNLRDQNRDWMKVAQNGVQYFVAQAMVFKVPFAMETVFSHWKARPDGTFESKIDLIRQMQEADYFVLLLFVGLSNSDLSIARVMTRVAAGGHNIDAETLKDRFPRTQRAIFHASSVADATILFDNSREEKQAFTVCRVQLKAEEKYDRRASTRKVEPAILEWLNVVAPRDPSSE